jgi:hypothetical protein
MIGGTAPPNQSSLIPEAEGLEVMAMNAAVGNRSSSVLHADKVSQIWTS